MQHLTQTQLIIYFCDANKCKKYQCKKIFYKAKIFSQKISYVNVKVKIINMQLTQLTLQLLEPTKLPGTR